MPKIWRILSIDGGGTRGIVAATILASIEKQTGKPISQLFDLIAGTSTGGILALGLTKPNKHGQPEFSAQDLCDLYKREIPKIFSNPQSWWGNLIGPKYRSFAFQQVLEEAFGNYYLHSALCDLLIPCYDIENRSPYIFRSRLAKDHVDHDFHMRDVALAACASPTLFYPVRFPRPRGGKSICLVDGGVFANNPAINALAEVRSLNADESPKCFMVSLGTGKSTLALSNEWISLWGYVQWSRPMLELVMESISESVHEQIQHLLSAADAHHYYRLQMDFPAGTNPAIDNASQSNMQSLDLAAQAYCEDSEKGQELSKICEILLSLNRESKD
ncbi:MAG: patatin-like phospholipase family protein [Candidatus Obscuribacterales bacterium]|nr:patatin-like phospholipase family protein [Candidatus Obscuribacterales bacterium]